MDRILLLFCSILSCFIVVSILFQFMNSNYERVYKKKRVYIISNLSAVILLTFVNMLNNSLWNLVTWILVTAICAIFLYYQNQNNAWKTVVECEAMALCISVCESLGVILLHWILQMFNANINDVVIMHCLEVTFSKLILIFLYYLGVNRLQKKKNFPLSKDQYLVYIIMLIYSFANMLLIVAEFMQRKTNYLWVANMGCIVLADLYLFYYIKMSNDKSFYESQVKALEQQASIQYGYYLLQTEKYNNTLRILHDVNKHIKVIEELYETDQSKTAAAYTKHINDMLKPLMPTQYSGNPILDILLTDKAMDMEEKGIDFDFDIDNVDLQCIEPIDITTIFGNLLDNSIDAVERFEGHKFVYIKIRAYQKMVSIKVENNSNYVKWKNGMPVSEKGKERGIGILNVKRSISKYDGDIKLRWENNKFIAEMFLNT